MAEPTVYPENGQQGRKSGSLSGNRAVYPENGRSIRKTGSKAGNRAAWLENGQHGFVWGKN
jgi:hypothetical protein